MLIASLGKGKIQLDQPQLKLREVLGHKPSEVGVGALLGIVLGVLFNYNQASALIAWLKAIPGHPELIVYVSLFALLLIGGLIQRLVFRRRYPRSAVLRRLSSQILTAALTTGIIGLVLGAFVYERGAYLSWRGWSDLSLAAAVIWGFIIASHHWRTLPAALAAEANIARKLKWLSWGKRQRS